MPTAIISVSLQTHKPKYEFNLFRLRAPRADIMLATLKHPISLENSIGITVKNYEITLRIVLPAEQDFSLYLSGFLWHKALRVLRKTITVVNSVKMGGMRNTRRIPECGIWA